MSYSGSARGLSGYGGFGGSMAGGAYGERGFAAGPDGAAGGRAGATGRVYSGPNGTEVAHGTVGAAGAAVGPNGAAAGAGAASGTVVKGPEGNTYAHGEVVGGGVAAGPDGVAGGMRASSGTAVRGSNGGAYAYGRTLGAGAVAGPDGAAGGVRAASGMAIRGPEGGAYAHGSGFYAGARSTGTWHCSAANMRVQGNYVRSDFDSYGAFNRNWYARYPGAWYTRGYAAGAWSHATWPSINSWFDTSWPATSYSYGDNITYEDDDVCLNGQPIASAADYYQSALNLAQTGEEADIPYEQPPEDGEQATSTNGADAQWLPLGVFEGIPPNEKSSHMLFQLAVNREGIVRGNYFNKSDNNAQQIQGAVDKQTQRVSWVVANRKGILFDTGLYNLTKSETTVLVHEGPEKPQQWTFVRLKQPTEGASQD